MNRTRPLARNIQRVAMVPVLGFALLCVFLGYWQVFRAPDLRADQYNRWAHERVRNTEPGRLLDARERVVLGAERGAEGWERTYPAGVGAAHLTGYNERSGLQRSLRDAMLGIGRYESPWAEFIEGPTHGNDVRLTIDLETQRLATRLLRRHRGAVVALDARTGAVLALVSAPTYDPEEVLASTYSYRLFQDDPEKPEYNRAVQGLYPPGSVMKVFTAAVALDLDRVKRDTKFECSGSYSIDGARITCPRTHGSVTIERALAVSCNTTFAQLGRYFSADEYVDYAGRFGLLDPATLPLPSSRGSIAGFTGADRDLMLAQTAIGQGETLITPLAIARMTLTVANRGRGLEPYLVESIRAPSGRVIAQARPREVASPVSAETARVLAGMMATAVEDGTGRPAAIRGVRVAGKTGSAENPHGKAHSWFTAFAPVDEPRVVVTAIVENAGAGSEFAAPIVREVMAHLLQNPDAI